MKRSTTGIHAPNLRTWHLPQMLDAITPSGAVTVLHHQLFERDEWTGQGGDVENLYWYGPLRYGRDPERHGGDGWYPGPERLIHIRAYDAHQWRSMDPAAWGEHIARKLMRWTGHNYPEVNIWHDPLVVVTLCNEVNIEGWIVSHLGGERERRDAYTLIGEWQLAAMQAVDDELDRHGIERRALLGWGALAFGHDMIPGVPDSEYQNVAVREAIEYADVLTAHPYGARHNPATWSGSGIKDRWFFMDRPFRPSGIDGHALGGCAVQFPHKPLLITEVGTFSHDTHPRESAAALQEHWRLAAASGQCIGATAYMWHAGPEHAVNSISDPAMRDALAATGPIYTDATVPAARPGGAGGGGHPIPVPPPTEADMTTRLAQRLRDAFGDDFRDLRGSLPTRDDSPWPWPSRNANAIEWLTVHHTATPTSATWEEAARYHVHSKRWPGIGYTFGIRAGQLALMGNVEEVRWHDSDNYPSVAVALMGHHDNDAPSERNVAALRRLVAVLDEWRAEDVGAAPLKIRGHGQSPGAFTACPGVHLSALLPTLRHDAPPSLVAVLAEAAAEAQVLRLNPGAALQKAMLADGLVPTSEEFTTAHEGAEYIAQRAEDMATGRVFAYYVKRGEWHDVRRVELRSAA